MNTFKAIVITENNDQVSYGIEIVNLNSLSDGEILIKVSYSSINFKDMLAVQKNGGVIRDYPKKSKMTIVRVGFRRARYLTYVIRSPKMS